MHHAPARVGRVLQARIAGAAGALRWQWRRTFEKAKGPGRLPAWLGSANAALASAFVLVIGVAGTVVWYSGDRQPLLTVRMSDHAGGAPPVEEGGAWSAPTRSDEPDGNIAAAVPAAGAAVRVAGPAVLPLDAAEPDLALDVVSLDRPDRRAGEIVEAPVGPEKPSNIGSPYDQVSDAVDQETETIAPLADETAESEPVAALTDDVGTAVAVAHLAANATDGEAQGIAQVSRGGDNGAELPVALVLGADGRLRLDHVRMRQASAEGRGEAVGHVDAAADLPYVTPLLPDVHVVEEAALTDNGAATSSLRLGGEATVATADAVPDAQEVVLLNASLEEAQARQAQEIARLLALAEEAIADNRLLIPETDSAHHHLEQVLSLDAENAQAQAGIERIVQRYAELARNALGEGALDKAGVFVGRGQRVDADSALIRTVDAEVRQAIAEAEAAAVRAAELERMAAEYVPPSPVVEVEPKKKAPSSFERLMRVVNGL
jgi:hypothetical protein